MPVTRESVRKCGKRQAGADADFEDALARPVVGDPHRRLAAGMKDRAENDVVGAGKQAIGADRVMQIHCVAFVMIHRGRGARYRSEADRSELID